jgi:hypothetical protein
LKNNFMLFVKKLEQEVQTKEFRTPFNLWNWALPYL